MAMQPLPVPTSTISGVTVLADERQRFLDDELRLVSGDQHVGSDLERQAPELAGAEDVGHRLAALAAGDQRLVAQQKHARRGLVAIGEKTCAIPAQYLTREHLGVERGEIGADARVHEAVARALHEIVDRHHHALSLP